MRKVWVGRYGVHFDRALFADHPRAGELPAILLKGLVPAIDKLFRDHGVPPISWEIRDDGKIIQFVPLVPGDCLPEVRWAFETLAKE